MIANSFIVDKLRLDAMMPQSWDGDLNNSFFSRFPYKFALFMNLIVVIDHKANVFHIMKNRWHLGDDNLNNGEHSLDLFDDWFEKLNNYVRDIDAEFKRLESDQGLLSGDQERKDTP